MHNGAVFVGSEGWIIICYEKVVASRPSVLDSEIAPGEIHLPDSSLATVPAGLPKGQQQLYTASHHQNWIRAIREGTPTVGDIDGAVRSDLACQLAELAVRTGHALTWDEKKETIRGNNEARKCIAPQDARALEPGMMLLALALAASEFFALDTAMVKNLAKDLPTAADVDTVAELGYPGIAVVVPNEAAWKNLRTVVLPALDRRKLKLYGIYSRMQVTRERCAIDPEIARALPELEARGAVIWLATGSKEFKSSDTAADPLIVDAVSGLARQGGATPLIHFALPAHVGSGGAHHGRTRCAWPQDQPAERGSDLQPLPCAAGPTASSI